MATTPIYGFNVVQTSPDMAYDILSQVRDFQYEVDTVLASITGGAPVTLADPGGNGIVVRTASATTVARSLANAAAGLTWTNGDGVAGNPTPVLANDLAALEALTGTGFPKRTGVDAWSLGSLVAGDIPDLSGTYQPLNAKLTAISALANAAGWLHNDGAGVFAYSTPTNTDVGLSNVTNDAQTKASIVPNTLPSSAQILVGNAGGTAYAPVSVSGDVTISNAGVTAIGALKVTNAMLAGSIDSSKLAAMTSAQLRGILSDENGTGDALFNSATSPTFLVALTVPQVNFPSGGIINFSSSDVTVTHSTNTLAFAGSAVGYLFDTKVGINNSAPSKLLHVGAGTDTPVTTIDGIYLALNGNTGFAIRDCTNDIEYQFAIANAVLAGVLMGSVTNHPVVMRTNAAEVMRWTAGGNVGIAAPNARKKLDILSTSQAQLRLTYTDNSVYSDFTVGSGGNLTIAPTGDLVFDPTGNDILPETNYDLNLGSPSKKYLTLHAAELWVETLVAQDTIATIGGRILVGPTTVLTSDISAVATTILVKHNEMAVGDRIYMEAAGSVEFMAVTAGPTGTGPYSYTVTRNLDGSGANAWSAGDAVFNTGTTGDGFIDLYSVRGVKAGTEIGPTIVGNVRASATYNDWSPRWAIGNLNGLYGYGVTTYGAAFGVPSAAWIKIDPTNGIRIGHNVTDKIVLDASGNASFTGSITAASGTVGGWTIGASTLTGGNATLNSTGKLTLGTSNDVINIDAADATYRLAIGHATYASAPFRVTKAGVLTATGATITGTVTATAGAIGGFDIGADYIRDAANSFGLASTVTGGDDVRFWAGNTFANRATAPFRLTEAGALVATSATITGAITATSGAIDGPLTMSGASSSIAIGATPPTSATVGTGLWLDRNSLVALTADVQKAVFSSSGIQVIGQGSFQAKNAAGVPLNVFTLAAASGVTESVLENTAGAAGTDGRITIKASDQDGNYAYIRVNALQFSLSDVRIYHDTALAGLTVGANAAPAATLDVRGDVLASSFIRSNSALAGIGYDTGAGGTVTQVTSKANGVTIHKVCGTITLHNAALAADTAVTFTVTNSSVAATDVIVVQHDSGGTIGAYTVTPNTPAAGSFKITVRNVTAGSLSEAIVIRFVVLKAVTS